ncbi:GlxA family transcriptional regulator [Endozoicomonas ascidiicola]|uniref:GlxA family transcriptional regulator n=1 Tax=Endozoicomonas ascidiicola TaxID=1698521 RepID=UPI000833E701|nr:helix-turn-helix domain-containing protein [Endozoicomonas ascidiicola]
MLKQPISLSIRRVFILTIEHMISTSITLPLEMLEAARTYQDIHKPPDKTDILFCSNQENAVTTTGGLRITPDSPLSATGHGDLILIPALWRNPVPLVRKNPAIVNWIKEQHKAGAVFVVAGTGVTFMAAAGLLNRQPATTHWFYMNTLQRAFPAVDFMPNHLITRAGRIYCAGSVNSVADLMVHLIEGAFSTTIARKVEQQFSHEIRKSFKETHFAEDHKTAHQDEVIVALQDFIHQHFANDISIEDLCRLSDLNSRTLNRRFREAARITPMAYVRQIRLDQARDLLKNTNLGIAEIAVQAGFSDPDYFARLFKRDYQLTPTEFRRSVRGKLFYLND